MSTHVKDEVKKLKRSRVESKDRKSTIHAYSQFFDSLIELIPARYYLPSDDSKAWYQGLSKTAKASCRQQSRENIKKARQNRLDPEKSSATTLDVLNERLQNEKAGHQKEDVDDCDAAIAPGKPIIAEGDGGQSVTHKELFGRYHKRLEELRSARGGSEKVMKNLKFEKFEKRENQQKKRKRDTKPEDAKVEDNEEKKLEEDASAAAEQLAFVKVKLDNEEQEKKRKKMPKEKEYERAKRLEELKKDPERGNTVAKKHSWKAATDRAAGIKVHDNPKLIKQSMHKEKKKHEKNVGKWKDRIETREKLKAEKQHSRAENIAERANQKKMRKIAKREKKLLRPGFEGRKEGYINETQS